MKEKHGCDLNSEKLTMGKANNKNNYSGYLGKLKSAEKFLPPIMFYQASEKYIRFNRDNWLGSYQCILVFELRRRREFYWV